MTDELKAVVREPGTGSATWAMGSLFEHMLESHESDDRLGVALVTQPPGIATPLHRHTREAEAFYLLDGEMTYRAGEDTFEVYTGCFVYLPQGLPHAFRTRGQVRYLALTEPGRLLHLYDEVGISAAERRLPGEDGLPIAEEIARWNEIGPRYGLDVVGPPIPE